MFSYKRVSEVDSFDQDNQKHKQNEGEEPYSFIEEHVRKRPFDWRKFLWGALRLFLSAIVFGAVAGFVFVQVTGGEGLLRMKPDVALLTEAPETSQAPGTRTAGSSARDASKTAESTDASKLPVSETDGPKTGNMTDSARKDPKTTSSDGREASQDKSSNGRQEGSGKKTSKITPTPTPTPTVEELEAESLRVCERFQAALGRVFEETLTHLAFVTSTSGEEDSIFGSAGEISKDAGLILGKDSRRLFILLEHLPQGKKHQATFADSSNAAARVFASDPSTGFTIMAVQLRELDAATLESCTPAELGNSYSLRRDDLVLAVGMTIGETCGYRRGTILTTDYPHNVPDREYRLLATDIPGAYGQDGFLVDKQGRVVGIYSDKFTPAGTDLITALPISMVKTLLTNMMNREKLVSLGIMGRDISVEEAEKLSVPTGIYVLYAEEESAALKAGIRTGDVIIGINGKEITSLLLLEEELYRHEPGDSLTVTLMRLCPDGYEEVTCEAILDPLEAGS